MTEIRLMLADDHSIFRESLKYVLETKKNFRVTAEAKNGRECLNILSERSVDLLILDIHMPDKNGFDVLEQLNIDDNRDIKVLILTGCDKKEPFLRALKIGIDGYLLKTSGIDVLTDAIVSIMNDEKYIQPELTIFLDMKRSIIENDTERVKSLTRREMDVLKNMAVGMYNKEIALKLGISERTVKNHISSIFKKIGVSDRTQAAVFAIRNELVDVFK